MSFYVSTATFILLYCDEWDRVVALPRHKFVTGATLLQLVNMDKSTYSTLLKYFENTEYTDNLTESEKRKLRKQAKHYVSKDNLLYYVSAKGETRRVVREIEKHRILRTSHSDSTAGKYIFYALP